MKLVIVCFMALTIASIKCDVNELTTPSSVSVTQSSPITIDPKLRKALLEALTNFGGEESTESDEDFGTTTDGSTDLPEDITNNPLVKIHSFAIDGDKSNENEIIKTIIISRPRTTLTPPKTNDIELIDDKVEINFGNKTPDPINEEEVKIDNIQLARSVTTNISAASNNNVVKKEEKLKKKTTVKSVTKPITPQPTTTTLPPPVTNSDGENIEKVKGEDVKIFQAPLLAAFTVQQDANGQPKNIISLFKNNQQNEISNGKITNLQFKASQPLQSLSISMTPTALPSTTLTTQSFRTNQPNQQQFLSAYEEKQRQLEHQILFLQAKQREQEELIRRHNLLQEQQNRQQFIDQRLRLQQNEQENFFRQQQQQQLQQQQNFQSNQQQQQNFQSNQQQQFRSNQQNFDSNQQNFDSNQQNFQSNQQNFDSNQQNFQSNQQNFINPPKNQVLQAPPTTNNIQFIESVPVGHTVGISVEQQLPFKGPVEFNPDNPDRQKTFTQLQQQYQHKQQQKQSQNQQQIFQKANQQFNQNFNQQTNQQNQNFNNNNQQNQNFNQNFQNQGFQQNNQQQPSAQALIQKQEVQEFSFLPQLTLNQELPNRQAGAFIPQFTPLPTGLELPLRAYQTFNSSPLTVLPSLTDIAQPSEARNRVFRQDAGQTGNFGINDQQQQQINHQQQQQFNPNESALDSQLQNLLLQSGLSTRSAEDFRIISKVLALNHGVPNNLFFNDNRF